MIRALKCLTVVCEGNHKEQKKENRLTRMEDLYAIYRAMEIELNEPQARFRREYEELRAIEKMEAALAGARKRLGLAAARLMSTR